MLLILGLMFVGIAIGYLIRNKTKFKKIIDKIVVASIYALLFFIGVNVGANELIIKNLYKIGATALILTFGAVSGTILISLIVYKKFFE